MQRDDFFLLVNTIILYGKYMAHIDINKNNIIVTRKFLTQTLHQEYILPKQPLSSNST